MSTWFFYLKILFFCVVECRSIIIITIILCRSCRPRVNELSGVIRAFEKPENSASCTETKRESRLAPVSRNRGSGRILVFARLNSSGVGERYYRNAGKNIALRTQNPRTNCSTASCSRPRSTRAAGTWARRPFRTRDSDCTSRTGTPSWPRTPGSLKRSRITYARGGQTSVRTLVYRVLNVHTDNRARRQIIIISERDMLCIIRTRQKSLRLRFEYEKIVHSRMNGTN